MTIHFEQANGCWKAQSGKYEVRRQGLRVGERFILSINGMQEASFYASCSKTAGDGGPEYIWTLGASQRTAENPVGLETYASVYRAFFETYQGSFDLPTGPVSLAFDSEIERTEWDRWGP